LLQPPSDTELISAAVALLVAALIWGAAHLAGRWIAPRMAQLWAQFAGDRREGIADRMGELVRYGAAALGLAIAIQADGWPLLPELLLGLAMAAAAGLFIFTFVRALHLPRGAGWVLGGAAAIMILTDILDALSDIKLLLDQIGITIGSTRLSIWTVLQVGVTLLILLAAIRLASRVINHSIARTRGLDATQQLLAQKLAGVALLVAAFFIGIDIIGIDLTAFAVFSGAFGLAVGFGLQKTFGNLIAGIILLMDRSIKPGDVIVVGDSFGHVTKIGVRAVSVVTRDGKEHLIPNENLMTQEVENWSYSSKDVRIHIPVGISYEADLPLAQKLMVEAARASKRVLANPAPTVWLRAFGESSVDHEILAWISDPEGGVGNVQSEVLNRLWLLFKENGIALPYPQRDIHVKDWPGPPPLEKQ
jgi:small-conductance mechanosensitive channel